MPSPVRREVNPSQKVEYKSFNTITSRHLSCSRTICHSNALRYSSTAEQPAVPRQSEDVTRFGVLQSYRVGTTAIQHGENEQPLNGIHSIRPLLQDQVSVDRSMRRHTIVV